MRASRYFMPTLREVPAEAEVISHRLLLRGGFVRKTAAGVYSYLPLGLRVHTKIARIVREEMNAIGAHEIFMPVLVPRELLEESGRAGVDVLMPLKDRNGRDFFLGFTHEEVVTEIVRSFVHSWRQLPLTLYQIQTKFRDEPRPRGGLIRAREFTMKDSYSFDLNEEAMARSYELHSRAYERAFQRMGLDFLTVDADTGDIGGTESREFMILAESGEDTVLQCDRCGYAANAERAEIGAEQLPDPPEASADARPSTVLATPGAHTVAQVCDFLGVAPEKLIKTIIVEFRGEPVAALVRGDRDLNLSKLARAMGGGSIKMAEPPLIERVTGAPVGFAGPVGLPETVRIVADHELKGVTDMVAGANESDAHRVGVTPGEEFQVDQWADIRVAVAGDRCSRPGCEGRYRDAHGIEVGHIFQLGNRYSDVMQAQVTAEEGDKRDILMGCYGLGISRTLAAAIEAHHDEDGIRWPISIAPFQAVVIVVNAKDAPQILAAEQVYQALLEAGVEVLIDDRDERSGVKFKDADLIGYPIRIVAGRAAAEGKVEIGLRRDKAATATVSTDEAAGYVTDLISRELQRL